MNILDDDLDDEEINFSSIGKHVKRAIKIKEISPDNVREIIHIVPTVYVPNPIKSEYYSNINFPSEIERGEKFIEHLIQNNNLIGLKLEIEVNRFDVNYETILGRTALVIALKYQQIDIITYLLSLNKLDKEFRDSRDRGYLYWAFKTNNYFIIEQIVEQDISFKKSEVERIIKDFNGQKNDVAAFISFIENVGLDFFPELNFNTLIQDVGTSYNLKMFLKAFPDDINFQDRNENGETHLLLSYKKEDKSLFEYILSVDDESMHIEGSDGKSIIEKNIEDGNMDYIDTILQKANINFESKNRHGESILIQILKSTNLGENEKSELIDKYAEEMEFSTANSYNTTPLYFALHLKDVSLINLIIINTKRTYIIDNSGDDIYRQISALDDQEIHYVLKKVDDYTFTTAYNAFQEAQALSLEI
jgi:ankyrin repeat protein